MKTTTPWVDYKAAPIITAAVDGKQQIRVHVTVPAPIRCTAFIPCRDGWHIISGSGVGSYPTLQGEIDQRTRGWRGTWKRGEKHPSGPEFIQAALEEGLDSELSISLDFDEWGRVNMLCGSLGISPGAWYLFCAMSAAEKGEKSAAGSAETSIRLAAAAKDGNA